MPLTVPSAGSRTIAWLLHAVAIAAITLLHPTASLAAEPSLKRVDSTFLKAFFAGRIEVPFTGDKFEFEEDSRPQAAAAAQECRQRREFRLLYPTDIAVPGIGVTWAEFSRYVVMLCDSGPLAADKFEATIDTGLASLMKSGSPSAELQDFLGFPLTIGNRKGRTAILFEIGHGIIAVPLAAIPTGSKQTTLLIILDDVHLGNPGHDIKRAMTDLAGLLKAADEQSRLR
jgi:hypothetical protein